MNHIPTTPELGPVEVFSFDEISRRVVHTRINPMRSWFLAKFGLQYFVCYKNNVGANTLFQEVHPVKINNLPADARKRIYGIRNNLPNIETVFEFREQVSGGAIYLGAREIWVPMAPHFELI